ncbi:hypothetical protein HRR83_004183 [Exophiala dermatitidis]|uniref:Uncharacterized protein n=1 Tax=Exophiala dermatitidis TaxID=5970 RepID=A0AAN6ESZ9_EXODE|nr:hypothetical protein HRR73_006356 [Exophiala dermatitidis]KAJ4521513.1 hypothetical protein HRR74_003337 [Exophiala dermatitidis]KAJ4542189.1 hypothetical protein HRR77_006071 [Exophiala dermatitidis]KAJ4544956.1 hypothetical protein HRR76_002989 [Exophiala dermatitidis]KAJ4565429.1 hypothetical protein HRR79_005689 [Exophiala dermatitidis]
MVNILRQNGGCNFQSEGSKPRLVPIVSCVNVDCVDNRDALCVAAYLAGLVFVLGVTGHNWLSRILESRNQRSENKRSSQQRHLSAAHRNVAASRETACL